MARVVLVTGGTRGIGRAIAERFWMSGDLVAILFQKEHKLASVWQREHAGTLAIQADVSQRSQVDRAVGLIHQTWGKIQVLVNNAGIAQQKMFCDITPEDWKRMFAVHVDGVYHATQLVLPDMVERKAGSIVNITSMWGEVGASCEVHYSAAKAAVEGMTKALAKELGPSGIRVNCVSPGVIHTEMNAQLGAADLAQLQEETPLTRIGTPEEVAEAAYYLAGDGARFITGQILGVNGGFVIR